MSKLALLVALAFALTGSASATLPASLPDLDQATPFGTSVVQRDGRLLLVFGSAVDNVGPGPLVVEARRVGGVMRARQVVGANAFELGTPLRYVRSETHQHWHLLAFERYELRRSGALVGRDRKTGFCLRDAYETRALNRVPRWNGDCGRRRPAARTVDEESRPASATTTSRRRKASRSTSRTSRRGVTCSSTSRTRIRSCVSGPT